MYTKSLPTLEICSTPHLKTKSLQTYISILKNPDCPITHSPGIGDFAKQIIFPVLRANLSNSKRKWTFHKLSIYSWDLSKTTWSSLYQMHFLCLWASYYLHPPSFGEESSGADWPYGPPECDQAHIFGRQGNSGLWPRLLLQGGDWAGLGRTLQQLQELGKALVPGTGPGAWGRPFAWTSFGLQAMALPAIIVRWESCIRQKKKPNLGVASCFLSCDQGLASTDHKCTQLPFKNFMDYHILMILVWKLDKKYI